MDADALTLPTEPAPLRRPPLPLLAALVPIAGGVVLWLVTGSLLSLCFAAIGPLMLAASLVDGLRTRRRELREATAAAEAAWRRAEEELQTRHEAERVALRRAHPDAAACVLERPLRDVCAADATTEVVVGSGACPSRVHVSGGEGDRAREFRQRSRVLEDAPLVVPLGAGVIVRGPEPIAAAVVRALVVQLCLRFSPAQLAISGADRAPLGIAGFPHTQAVRRGAWRVAVRGDADAGADAAADAQLIIAPPDAEIPAGLSTVIDCVDPMHARVRTPDGVRDVALECVSAAQAEAIAAQCAALGDGADELPQRVGLHELCVPGVGARSATTLGAAAAGAAVPGPAVPGAADGVGRSAGLAAAIGRDARGDAVLDLVEDGPHAIVTGMTGSGKSELLVSWVTSMASAYSPDQVVFVLADFKGGTAFDPLLELPHVAAVITDLDDDGARRGVQSLTAELRRREAALASAGARSIADAGVSLPRLVIVVDEFAALLQEHPDLSAVFTDVAARGRALGMHLILGTQRAAGVVREALAANCPLRVSLRVTEAADSRLVIGSDDAAELPGGAESRGLAFIRRPQDSAARCVRVALTAQSDLRRVAAAWPAAVRPVSPWLPPLPVRLPLERLRTAVAPAGAVPIAGAGPTSGAVAGVGPMAGTVPMAGAGRADADSGVVARVERDAVDAGARSAWVLGLADEPHRQAQPIVWLRAGEDRGLAIVGGPGSGRTTALRVLAAQGSGAVMLPDDPEALWDAVADLAEPGARMPRLLLCDDLDRAAARFPGDFAQVFLERFERMIRGAGESIVVVTAGRAAGPVGRVLEALPARLVLRTRSKLEHLAAGGEPDAFRRDRPPGRGDLGGREVQIAWVDPHDAVGAEREATGVKRRWMPSAPITGVVCRGMRRTTEALRTAFPGCRVLPASDPAASDTSASDPSASDPSASDPSASDPSQVRTIIVGDADLWQRHWTLWQRVRDAGEVLVLADCQAELRTLAGVRELPPYARPHAGRAWSLGGDGGIRRVIVPGLVPAAR